VLFLHAKVANFVGDLGFCLIVTFVFGNFNCETKSPNKKDQIEIQLQL
jgi:hypothetical protein